MNEAKIRLSTEEMTLVKNSEWILTKNSILEKATRLLALLQQEYQIIAHSNYEFLPAEFANSSPKISRGENYEGLPYRVLDYPAVFQRDHMIAIRTMFWWGNFFSTTLHLSGKYKQQFERKIIAHQPLFAENNFYMSTGTNEWDNRFSPDNYCSFTLLNEAAVKETFETKNFVKMAAKTDVSDWDAASVQLHRQFTQLIKFLVD
jgi:hypothetical protein